MQNTTTKPQRQSVRRYPAWKLNALIRRAGLNHLDIATRAGVSESQVSHAIHRRRVNGQAIERVWAVLQDALGRNGAA